MAARLIDISRDAATPEPREQQPKRQIEAQAAPAELRWRAVVRTGTHFGASREADRVEWHLVGCSDEHCNEGLHLIETRGQPDGHCVVAGRCGLCGDDRATVGTEHRQAA